MIIKKSGKTIGEIDEKTLIIDAVLSGLMNLVQRYLTKGIIMPYKSKPMKDGEGRYDMVQRLYPRHGKAFWRALRERLVLEGYDDARI